MGRYPGWDNTLRRDDTLGWDDLCAVGRYEPEDRGEDRTEIETETELETEIETEVEIKIETEPEVGNN